MNFKIGLALFFSFGAFIISLFLLYKSSSVNKGPVKPDVVKEETLPEKEEPLEIAHFMNRIQVFHNKLFFAGKAGNKMLALFYLDEIEEEMGVIAEAGIFDVDANIRDNMKIYGLKQVDWMRGQVETGFDSFENDFTLLTESCNSCHAVTKKEFVKIAVPTSPIFTNQNYNP